MDAIRWEGNTLYLLDQTKLPVTEEWISYTDYRPVAVAIRTMVVRGAPAIGVTAAYAYCLAALAGEAPVYVVHLSSAAGLAEVRKARAAGQRHFGVETCTQYLKLEFDGTGVLEFLSIQEYTAAAEN